MNSSVLFPTITAEAAEPAGFARPGNIFLLRLLSAAGVAYANVAGRSSVRKNLTIARQERRVQLAGRGHQEPIEGIGQRGARDTSRVEGNVNRHFFFNDTPTTE